MKKTFFTINWLTKNLNRHGIKIFELARNGLKEDVKYFEYLGIARVFKISFSRKIIFGFFEVDPPGFLVK